MSFRVCQIGGGSVTIMTWGGLRGGISVALALSLPVGSERELVLAMTYVLVVFSILVQGLTINQVVMCFMRSLSIAVKS